MDKDILKIAFRINELEKQFSCLLQELRDKPKEQERLTKKKSLTFGEALVWMKDGKNVSRWHRDDIFIWLDTKKGHPDQLPIIWVQTINAEVAPWTPNHQDLLCETWRVIEEPSCHDA